MSDRNSTTSQGLVARLAKKLLMPLVATGVTAAASYVGKKAPQLIEDKIMPKLREAPPHSVGDLADGLAERAKAVVGSHEVDRGPAKRLSPAQRDAQRRERAAQREARRTGSGAKED
jgi:hypothetical protein